MLGYGLVFEMLIATGCDFGSNSKVSRPDNSDEAVLRAALGNLTEFTKNIGAMKQLYASGVTVTAKEQKEMRGKQFKLAEPVSIKAEGNTATFKVLVRQGENETTVEWTAVKESDTWKLQKTPVK